ncbi:hypothetical protein IHE45_07G072700 [Dioscorea alata]|uniref:Uncharacterized protein n=1 Tax=Dioscorea alata TaxID=55571 RepID=A0ACB7VSE4_DIOAL|nr:hypothetical protein IHE45_07G072700 [Dioscorea alata]
MKAEEMKCLSVPWRQAKHLSQGQTVWWKSVF